MCLVNDMEVLAAGLALASVLALRARAAAAPTAAAPLVKSHSLPWEKKGLGRDFELGEYTLSAV